MSEKFRGKGGEIYLPAAERPASWRGPSYEESRQVRVDAVDTP